MSPNPTTTTLLFACQAAILLTALISAPTSLAFVSSPGRATQNVFRTDLSLDQIQPGPLGFGSKPSLTSLSAAGGKKKRRRRKDQPEEAAEAKSSPVKKMESLEDFEEVTQDDIFTMQDVANFEFDQDLVNNEPAQGTASTIALPDIKDLLKRKEDDAKTAIQEEEQKEKRRIKKSDKKAFARLLEQQPYADADASYFEEEAYTTVSALLGEGAKPFLGIPTGPLQVGHFIGSLAIILMAFVQYPGFPLTNLPSPLRDCLQGGLAVTYTINLVLAVFAGFKSGERDQSALLWAAKTFSVGGLAYDQLSQLPTKDEKSKASK